ncbi:MAG: rhamnulokinase family protein, partial [Ilumatobacteraceae bacterium]
TKLTAAHPEVESIGIDTWAVDYGLLDGDGRLLGDPVAYRDTRTERSVRAVHDLVSEQELFELDGLQFLPFNTIYQLAAEVGGPIWPEAAHVVLLPDLLAYWLTGRLETEYTNATTTGLVDIRTGRWSPRLFDVLGIPPAMFPPIAPPGSTRGPLLPSVAERIGAPSSTVVVNVASHDTASAVVGIPAPVAPVAFIASGTWSLVGLELDRPLVTSAARAANFTNEGGVDGRTRFLRNVGGLWLLQECLRSWSAEGRDHDLARLLDAAAALPTGPIFDVDDDSLVAPDDMPRRIEAALAATGGARPASPAHVVRSIVDSLAAAYASTIRRGAELSGRTLEAVHIVGGGSQNELLCQATADAVGLPVIAGPVEATALGNVLVQARAIGALSGDLDDLRRCVTAGHHSRRYEPLIDRVTVETSASEASP